MDIVEYEMQRYEYCIDETKGEDSPDKRSHIDKLNTQVRKQEQLFRGTLIIFLNGLIKYIIYIKAAHGFVDTLKIFLSNYSVMEF